MVREVPAEVLDNLTQNLSLSTNLALRGKQFCQELNCGVEVFNLDHSGQFITLQDGAPAQSGDCLSEKHASSDFSLRQVLSDTISGFLMEDAMVMPCGHSFGISGLHCVKETNLCLTCGAPVPINSMIPNYALRDAVVAYKREGSRKQWDLHLQMESDGKRLNRAFADPEVSRPRGVQFPYVANDKVLIKGNKRTPERFMGREAIITAQCLNGWYLVKMLDNGESVRLQYRSLQKLGEEETTTEINHGTSTDAILNGDSLKGQSKNTCRISLFTDHEGGGPPKFINKIEDATFSSGIAKGPCLESLSRSNHTSHGCLQENHLRAADATMDSLHSGGTSSNSSQEFLIDQVQGICTQEAAIMYDSADEDQRATKKIAAIGGTGGAIEGSTLQSKHSIGEHSTIHCKVQEDDNGCEEVVSGSGSLGRSQGRHPRARSKHISLQFRKALSSRSGLHVTDPYKKVYASGLRWRANSGDSRGLRARKQSAFATLKVGADHCSVAPLLEHQEADVKTTGESSGHQSAVSFCEVLKKRMLDLETEIPRSFMQTNWKREKAVWLGMVKESCTLNVLAQDCCFLSSCFIQRNVHACLSRVWFANAVSFSLSDSTIYDSGCVKDVAKRLEELGRALILENAGNMSNNDWTREFEAAVESEAMEAVDYLWRKLYEDISRLLVSNFKQDSKPLSSIKSEFLELKNRFPQLCMGGLSHVGIIAATSIAAAEAYAVGEQDIETLLTIPMKLVQEHNVQDLRAVIDAIEREKDHLSAKVVHLGSGSPNHGKSNVEDADNVLIENPKQAPWVS